MVVNWKNIYKVAQKIVEFKNKGVDFLGGKIKFKMWKDKDGNNAPGFDFKKKF